MSVHIILENSSNKRSKEKNHLINQLEKDTLVLNFRNEFNVKEINKPVLHINADTLNPDISSLSVGDIGAVNAGVFEYIDVVLQMAEDIAFDEIRPEDRQSGSDLTEAIQDFRSTELFSESINRAICSWNQTISLHARKGSRFFDFNRVTQTVSFDELFGEIELFKEEHEGSPVVVNFFSEKMHTTKKRLLAYLFIHQYLDKIAPLNVFSNAINYLWREGHFKPFNDYFMTGEKDLDLFIFSNNPDHLPDSMGAVAQTVKINAPLNRPLTIERLGISEESHFLTETGKFNFYYRKNHQENNEEKTPPHLKVIYKK